MDEMAIKEDERRLDPSTKKWTGKCTLPTYSGIANKALVFMLADLTLFEDNDCILLNCAKNQKKLKEIRLVLLDLL